MGSEPQNTTSLIVCNTGPLLHLWQIRQQRLLNYLGRICIPVEVADEFNILTEQASIGIPVDTSSRGSLCETSKTVGSSTLFTSRRSDGDCSGKTAALYVVPYR
jgi:hypothetical protein